MPKYIFSASRFRILDVAGLYNEILVTLTLEKKDHSTIRTDVTGILPESTRGLTCSAVCKLNVLHGNRQLRLGELFDVTGSVDDGQMILQGELSSVDGIGSGLSWGLMAVESSTGHRTGAKMTDGRISVKGNVGDLAGAEMRGGVIHVAGDAGDQLGGAFTGNTRGMRGGTLFVDGNAGDEIGKRMRRGLIAIGGAAGDLVGLNMLAGSIVVCSRAGSQIGFGMKRGTIAILAGMEYRTPTFVDGGFNDSTIFRLMKNDIAASGFSGEIEPLAGPLNMFHGDLLAGGRGEILVPVSSENR